METVAAEVARNLGIPGRSMRRAVDVGMIRGRRVSERKYLVPLGEEVYLREHWNDLARLRQVLRTEPNVRLAVLFGSTARGTAGPNSDFDLMITTAEKSRPSIAGLVSRLEDRLGREVQVVHYDEVSGSPALLRSVTSEGRVLVDRDEEWQKIRKEGANFDGDDLDESMERLANGT